MEFPRYDEEPGIYSMEKEGLQRKGLEFNLYPLQTPADDGYPVLEFPRYDEEPGIYSSDD